VAAYAIDVTAWKFVAAPPYKQVNSRIEQQAQLELSSEDALLSLPTVGRLCDKLALQVSQTKPSLRIVKS
jgi:hypothetical protein